MSRSPFLLALANPVNLSMLALTLVAGLCSAWWLAPVGLLLWLVMVAVIARDPGLKITFTRQNRQPLAQRFQTRFDRLERARFSVFNALERSGSQIKLSAEPVVLALDELVEHAYQLSLRLSAIDNNYSVQLVTSNFAADISKMEKNIAETMDPASRKEFEATLQSLKARQSQLAAIGTLLSRFEAQLTGTTSAVDGVVTGVVGLQGRSVQLAREKIQPLLKIIAIEHGELERFDLELGQSDVL